MEVRKWVFIPHGKTQYGTGGGPEPLNVYRLSRRSISACYGDGYLLAIL